MSHDSLTRGLGFREAFALVIGTVIGTGVFLKTAVMTQTAGSFTWVMLAWIVAGLLSLAGALCFAELGSRYPEAGGEYAYLREAFGELPAFLNGWMRFAIGNPGSIAAYAVGMMTFLRGVFHYDDVTQTALACGVIAIFTAINCLTVRAAGLFHTFMAAVKILLIVGFTLALFGGPAGPSNALVVSFEGWPGWRPFGAAMLGALWAYDGWNGMPMAASEVRDPQKNIPRALLAGMIGVIGIYVLANTAFFRVLSLEQIALSNSPDHPSALPVATNAALTMMGGGMVAAVSVLLAFSALVSLNGSVLTSARLPFAMARDGLFFPAIGHVHPRTHSPIISVLVQGLIAIALSCSGTFDQLTDYVIFASWIFYALAIVALFVLRRRPAAPGVFLTPFFPFLPILFLLVSGWLIVNTLLTAPSESLIGLGLIASGTPVYLYYRRRR